MENFVISLFGDTAGFQIANLGYNLCKLALIGILFFVLESTLPAQESNFIKKDFWNELAYPIFNAIFSSHIVGFLVSGLTAYFLTPFFPYHIFSESIIQWPFFIQVFIGLLILDLIVYWEHRFEHLYLWPFHALHHMTQEVSWLTHVRIHPVNFLSIKIFNVFLLYTFGFSGDAIVTASFIIGWVAMYEHANLKIAYPKPFCYLFVSPHFHRWHHAKDKSAYDKNFCLMFPFIDLLFGTYYCLHSNPKNSV